MNDSTEVSHHGPNKFFLSVIGLWPHQPMMEKRFIFIITIFFVATQGYLQIAGLIMARCNPDIFMESIPPVTIDFVCYIKLFNFIYNGDKMRELLETIENDWKLYGVGDELKILREFGNDCRKKILMYAGVVYATMIPFMLGPLFPIIIELLPVEDTATSNETMTKPLMFHIEYLVNVERWYYWLLIHEYLATTAYITIVVGIDIMFFAYVHHACTLFAILGHRLENLVDSDALEIDLHPPMSEDKPYRKAINCITLHSLALDYVDAIESAYSTSMFFQLGINVLCLSFTGFQAVMKLDYPEESVRYATFAVAQVFPVFFASYPSECLLTESERILQSFTNSSWYLTSLRTRKLVNLMVMRSMRPCCLTAAHLYVLDMQFFATVIRTSVRYLTMLCSFR